MDPNQKDLAFRLEQYCILKGYRLDKKPGQVNIIYIEGADANGRANRDLDDKWNDRRIVLMFDDKGFPFIALNEVCTTEPGRAATMATKARKLGGVARIPFGQFTAWQVGFHQGKRSHPALVQRAPLPVHRDRNRDGKRPGDPIGLAQGINQHGTKSGYLGGNVGTWSEGCLVGMHWQQHLVFMHLVEHDPRYLGDKAFLFTTTVIAGDDFERTVMPPA